MTICNGKRYYMFSSTDVKIILPQTAASDSTRTHYLGVPHLESHHLETKKPSNYNMG